MLNWREPFTLHLRDLILLKLSSLLDECIQPVKDLWASILIHYFVDKWVNVKINPRRIQHCHFVTLFNSLTLGYTKKSITFHMSLLCIDLIAYPVPTSSLRYLTCCLHLITRKTATELRVNCLWRVLNLVLGIEGKFPQMLESLESLALLIALAGSCFSSVRYQISEVEGVCKSFELSLRFVSEVNRMNLTDKNCHDRIWVWIYWKAIFCWY